MKNTKQVSAVKRFRRPEVAFAACLRAHYLGRRTMFSAPTMDVPLITGKTSCLSRDAFQQTPAVK
eukprot:8156282-Prorocentrum_lima.AAC.1